MVEHLLPARRMKDDARSQQVHAGLKSEHQGSRGRRTKSFRPAWTTSQDCLKTTAITTKDDCLKTWHKIWASVLKIFVDLE
jgi:hypothetical protein